MNLTSFDKVRLERGGVILSSCPTIDDIVNAMQIAYDENGIEGPPELALECVSSSSSSEVSQTHLYMLLAFHRTHPPRWLIHYITPRAVGLSGLLSSGRNLEMQFERRTVCGVISLYRQECLINEPMLLRRAVVLVGQAPACLPCWA